jgi:hypothetical protein
VGTATGRGLILRHRNPLTIEHHGAPRTRGLVRIWHRLSKPAVPGSNPGGSVSTMEIGANQAGLCIRPLRTLAFVPASSRLEMGHGTFSFIPCAFGGHRLLYRPGVQLEGVEVADGG